MTESKLSAPERIWICTDSETPQLATWTKDFRACDFEYVRADLVAPVAVDVRAAAKAIIEFVFDDYPDNAMKRGDAINHVATLITAHMAQPSPTLQARQAAEEWFAPVRAQILDASVDKLAAIIITHFSSRGEVARVYRCSCGAACTAEEYIDHYFNQRHDRGEGQLSTTPTTAGQNYAWTDEKGVYHSMSPKKFSELRARMSPEAQARSAARTKELLDEIRSGEGGQIRGWQPIETACKDGEDLLLWIPEDDAPLIAYWRDDANGWDTDDGWLRKTPTHWMPLPEPPPITALESLKGSK